MKKFIFYMLLCFGYSTHASAVSDEYCSVEGVDYKTKIPQLFIITYSRAPGFKKYLDKNKFSGIIGFSHDLSSHKSFTSLRNELVNLGSTSYDKPLLTIDHEGGLVQRLKKFKEITYIPSAKILGQYFDSLSEKQALVEAQKIGEIMGRDLASIGFNWNFAPVFDVDYGFASNPMSKYYRAFSSKPSIVGKYATAISKGMSKHVITTAKHFPGQGITKIDSHFGSCKKTNSCPQFNMRDLEPFKLGIDAGVIDTVMVGHVYYPNLDNQLATYSSKIIKETLGQKLGFRGVVVSDDFTMGALGEALGVSAKKFRKGDAKNALGLALEKAFKSGIHIAVLSEFVNGRREEFATKYLCSKIKDDKQLRESIDEAYFRVQSLKVKAITIDHTIQSLDDRKKSYLFVQKILKKMIKQHGRKYIKKLDKSSLVRYKL